MSEFGRPVEHLPEPRAVFHVRSLAKWGWRCLQRMTVPLVSAGAVVWMMGLGVGSVSHALGLPDIVAALLPQDAESQQSAPAVAQMVAQLVSSPMTWLGTAGMVIATARCMTGTKAKASAALPTMSALLAYGGAMLCLYAVQLPFLMAMALGAGLGSTMATNEVEEPLWAILGGGLGGVVTFPLLVYVGLRLRLAPVAAVVEGSAIAGVKASWRIGKDFRALLHLALFGMLEFFASLVNLLLFCCTFGIIGIFTAPLLQGGLTAAYLRYSREPDSIGGYGIFDGP